MINISKPFLPPKEVYLAYIDAIYNRNWLTNNGPLVNELELKLKEYLNIPHLLFLTNGTIAIQIAIKALELRGEIITTPFSYVATTSSIVWEGCEPVFVDIDENTFNIDHKKIEAAITEKTTAILATHVYGNPCEIDSIQIIAEKYGLKVIYDAAHCFGTLYKGKSVFAYGDISTTSFHATKLFHTIEGGAVFTNNPDLLKKMSFLRNFGHKDAEHFECVGINGKNSEFHAAMGLANLNYVDAILESRKSLSLHYRNCLRGLNVKHIKIDNEVQFNYSYFPIVFDNEDELLKAEKILNDNLIFPRRYFFPSLSKLNYVKSQDLPIAEHISKSVLCLPLFFDLTKEEVGLICRLLLRVQNNKLI
jgi:dTDP-4-amino-4,6-dideoxygalactose transaminase